jgi:hypothetical protein
MEELHIELVVFDNQDLLAHSTPVRPGGSRRLDKPHTNFLREG